MAQHALAWHRCERWWNNGFTSCPISGNRPRREEEDDSNDDPLVPVGDRVLPEVFPVDKIMEAVPVPISLPVPIPIAKALRAPQAVPSPVAQPAARPNLALTPAYRQLDRLAQAAGGKAFQQPVAKNVQRNLEQVRAPTNQYQEAENWRSIESRLQWEAYQSGLKRESSVRVTSLPPYTNTSPRPPGPTAGAEYLSTRIAEEALARALRNARQTSSSGSREKREAVEEAERVVRGGDTPQPAKSPRDGGRGRAVAAAVTVAVAAGAAYVYSRGGGGRSSGRAAGSTGGRGGFKVQESTFRRSAKAATLGFNF